MNQRPYLEAMFESLRSQGYRNFEHLVVDGGSTDGTLEVLHSTPAGGAFSWISEPDKGMYEAVNKGLRLARGEILAYLATDDSYLPWTLEVVVDAFRRNPDAGLVLGDLISVFDDTLRGELRTNPHPDAGYLRRFFCLGQPAVFFRREVVEQCGYFDEDLKVIGDCEYWMRVAEHFRGVKVAEVLAVDRIRTASKRVVDSSLGEEEVARVRRPYQPRWQPARLVRDLLDRGRYAAARRGALLSLLAAALLRRAGLPPRVGRWPRFLSSSVCAELSPLAIALGLLPRVGQRWERHMVELAPPSLGKRDR